MQTATIDTRADADQHIWDAFRHHSRTFSLAARLLPRDVQMPIATLYMFCRRVDSIADERILEIGREAALAEVETVERHLNATLAGRPPDELLWQRLAEVHEGYDLQKGPLLELIEGARWDLEDRPVETLDDLVDYSNLVGGSVGAMMLPFLLSDAEARRLEGSARTLGIAMQITNILRDVGEDARELDRVYLPTRWLSHYDIDPSTLTGGSLPDAYPQLLEDVMEASEERYEESFAGIDALPWKMRFGIRAAARMYREIMNEVRANHYDNLNRRAYVSFRRKCFLSVVDTYNRRKKRLTRAQ
jgi:phytoene synthase